MSPGAVGGTLRSGGLIGPTVPGTRFLNVIPGGSLYFGSNGIFHNPPPITSSGGTVGVGGVGGVNGSVIVAGSSAGTPPGGRLTSGGVGGVKSSVIVAGGTSAAGNGTGTVVSSGAATGSASSVIVTGGSVSH